MPEILLQDGTFLQEFRLSQQCCGACDTVFWGEWFVTLWKLFAALKLTR